jgi:DNA-binding transcriptional MerR regulator
MVIAHESPQMIYIPGFPVLEASEISGVTVPRIHYLNRSGQIVPTKAANTKRATVLYSWAQLIQLKMIDILKSDNIKDIVVDSILKKIGNQYRDLDFLNQDFIIYNDTVYWFKRTESRKEVIAAIEKETENYTPDLASINIWSRAPYPQHKEYQAIEIKWNPFHSMRYVILMLVVNAKNSKEVDFEDFKKKVDYDSFKDSLELE